MCDIVDPARAGPAEERSVTPKPAPKPAPKPTLKPAPPTRDYDCRDFSTWQQAQTVFDRYYPGYGDVFELDADDDRIACESLPGNP